MLPLPVRLFLLSSYLCLPLAPAAALATLPMHAPEMQAPEIAIQGLGKGAIPLNGPWQFHTGDDPTWAQPDTADATGLNGWEQLSADQTWGAQSHPAYVGFAWYRRHIQLSPAPAVQPDFALLIQHIDDAYEIYWNGVLVGHNGELPPHPSYQIAQAAQTFGMGRASQGVLAVRVWKAPLYSFDTDQLGGFNAAPLIGSPGAIAAEKAVLDYAWLRGQQYSFGLVSLNALVMAVSLLGWSRDRSHRVLLWMAVFTAAHVGTLILLGLRLPWPSKIALALLQPVFSLQDIGLWFLLLRLLRLVDNPRIVKMTKILAVASFTATTLDGLLTMMDWSSPALELWAQYADAALTAVYTVVEAFPLVLVVLGMRSKLDSTRWLVAVCAFFSEMLAVARIATGQGVRFTHWTISAKLAAPLFFVNGNAFDAQTIADSLLLMAIVYAVYGSIRETIARQNSLEQEFRSARELQQVLIPSSLPELPGFAVTSAYQPALEVGGDFFQIIPLKGELAGDTLILLGDVSGKGLKAAMTVALIVGAVRALARFTPDPANLLSELNQRLCGRQQGGFTTCVAMRIGADGRCTMASAGHPSPFLNHREMELPGAFPLGIDRSATYEEAAFQFHEGDHFALYTDGLLEARGPDGELFSFERLDALFAARPSAEEATRAAVEYGQDDDVTVLTLTRLATGEQSTTLLSSPLFAPA